jgi:pyruvate/2-oxoglutarate dehydrogenase complex dihydrolipoamide acyltransferase (E2) component
MTVSVYIPKTGMGIQEGTITKWLKGVGDKVEQGEAIVEFETVKANGEIEAPSSGTLTGILVREGETVEVGTEIATIGDA